MPTVEKIEKLGEVYHIPDNLVKVREGVYKDLSLMLDKKTKTYPQFNDEFGDHTLMDFVDASLKRLNGYTFTREEQGKEDWQNNFFNNTTRAKMKAIVASVALQIPDFVYQAINKFGIFSAKRAEIVKQLVKASRLQENLQVEFFFEAWEAAGAGT